MKTRLLINKLGRIYPKNRSPFKGDFFGTPSGIKLPENVDKILLCLDLDSETMRKALELKVDLVITHHPFMFGRKNEVLKDKIKEAIYNTLKSYGIGCYSLHTNFDIAKEGMNFQLLKKLSTKEVYQSRNPESFLTIAELNTPMNAEQLLAHLKEKWQLPYLLFSPANFGKEMISRIGLVAGSGGREYNNAILEEVDVFITGEVAHHQRRDCYFKNLHLIEVPHEVEKHFIFIMENLLNLIAPEVKVFTYDNQNYPKAIITSINS